MFLRTVILLPLLALAACEGEATEPGMITREQFIQVNVDLRSIPPYAEDAEERRQQVLEEHGLTEEQVLEFIERSNYTPDELRRIWTEISDRLDDQKQASPTPTNGQSI